MGKALILSQVKELLDMMSTSEGEGVIENLSSKGGWVNFIVEFRSKYRQGMRGSKNLKILS